MHLLPNVEGNTDSAITISQIKGLLLANPLFLTGKTIENVAMSMLPYSSGIEIECDQKESYNVELFKAIPNIMAVQVDSSEQRYRIPNGLSGLVCLHNICSLLKEHCVKTQSGIHVHVDMTEHFHNITTESVALNEGWILKELDLWGYRRTYNSRQVGIDCGGVWLRFQTCFKTAEFRIIPMYFGYHKLLSMIIDAQRIVTKLIGEIKYYKELELLNEQAKFNVPDDLDLVEVNRIVKRRVIRI